jgi:transposase-like protein
MAETRDDAYKAFDSTVNRFGDKYPGAMKCLGKDKAQMLAFYDFPAIHWQHIRTSNRGELSLLIHVRKCFASLFTDRAISYRHSRD